MCSGHAADGADLRALEHYHLKHAKKMKELRRRNLELKEKASSKCAESMAFTVVADKTDTHGHY